MSVGSRMCHTVYIPEVLDAYVCVNLGCGKVFVSEQVFDNSKVGASVQQVGGKTVPQHVRVVRLNARQAREVTADDQFDTPGGEPAAEPAQEERLLVWAVFLEIRSPIQVAKKGLDRAPTQRCQAVAAAFPHNASRCRVRVDRVNVKTDKLPQAESASVENLEDRSVTQAENSSRDREVHGLTCLLLVKESRQRSVDPRRPQSGSRILGEETCTAHVPG